MTTTRDSILDIWGTRSPYHGEGRWPERVDERTSQEPENWVQSACVLCSNGCGLDIRVKGGRIVGVRGRALDTVNRGRLGPKGLHGWEANNSPDRLTRPLIRRNGALVPTSWDEAMHIVVSQVKQIRERYTANAIGFYTSGQMFLEEYYTLNVIARAGLGTPHLDGNTRLCTATAAAALKETGANGDLPGFRNWENPTHIDELARIWNVDPAIIPHWGPPTHALQIFRYCEIGSIRMLWIQATNPAVSLPDLSRVRSILQNPDLFIVVQDAFPTETTEFADVVLPVALWGEKTGTFTNADRTVHISHKAVEPPGEARADFDIFFDFARRMDFRDKDGAPLIKWAIPEEAFEAWKQCSRGRPCDYTGLSYAKLSAGSGICWPCNAHHPDGEPRPYKTLHFPTDHAECESSGHDLVTGGAISSEQYRARNPAGRAILKAAEYQSPAEEPDDAYPFLLTTGRLVYHFHTRTKTGRSKDLRDASPNDFVQIATEDAARLGIKDGSWIRLISRRGSLETRAWLGEVASGELFAPFHFGYCKTCGLSGTPASFVGQRDGAAALSRRTLWHEHR